MMVKRRKITLKELKEEEEYFIDCRKRQDEECNGKTLDAEILKDVYTNAA